MINRDLLLRRLEDFFSTESTAGRRSWGVAGDTTDKHAAGTAGVGPSSERTIHSARPASSSGAAWAERRQQHGGRRTFALVDVRKSLALPCERSDVLVPRLDAALRSAFGGAVTDGANHPPPRVAASSNVHRGSIAAGTASMEDRADSRRDDGGGTGARWLRDWGTKELVLDSEGLRETLGDVGLCGLAGWFLEYPVVYCCPSLVGSPDGTDRAGGTGGSTTEDVTGNCLAAVPLTVYSLSIDLGDQQGSGSSCRVRSDVLSDTTAEMSLHAFSFSVPERVCGPADADGGKQAVRVGLERLVGEFLGRMEGRVARHRSSSSISSHGLSSERHEQLLQGLNVNKRTETLDRVAL